MNAFQVIDVEGETTAAEIAHMFEDDLVDVIAEELELSVAHHVLAILAFGSSFALIVGKCAEDVLEYFELDVVLGWIEEGEHGTEVVAKTFFFLSAEVYSLQIWL